MDIDFFSTQSRDNPVTRDLVLMSPNRYWCIGAKAVFERTGISGFAVHVCHSLHSVKNVIRQCSSPVLIMEEFGDGENIQVFLEFYEWIKKSHPVSQMVIVRHPEKVSLGSILIRRGDELEANSSLADLDKLFSRIIRGRLNEYSVAIGDSKLTKRELSVLRAICHSESNFLIGERFGMDVDTVFAYKYRALNKLGLSRISPLLGRYKGILSYLQS